MRSLCNLAYAIQVEGKDEEETKHHDLDLAAEPGKEATGHSRNVGALMQAMNMGKARS